MEIGKTVFRYTLRNSQDVTIRVFRTNDAAFAGRVIAKSMLIHGTIRVSRRISK